MKDNQHEQLFTELTPAEAAVLEGGLRLTITRIQAIRAGADVIGADETYITANGSRIWGPNSMTSGQTRLVNRGLTTRGSAAQVQLFDDDPWPNRDDSMGGFTASNTNGALRRARVGGSGSTYDVYYRAYA